MILIVGPIQDVVWGLILVANAGIGIFQEVRAKRTLDRLAGAQRARAGWCATGSSPKWPSTRWCSTTCSSCAPVIRSPATVGCAPPMGWRSTSRSSPGRATRSTRVPGRGALGSVVVAGSGRFEATRVGADSYARKLAAEARRFQLTSSELMDGINTILRIVTWVLIPVSALLLWSQSRDHELDTALRFTVAGVVAMVPEGLVLLTSIAFMVAALSLARRRVLVQELPAVEGLACVDIVCLDKTGTLTEGEIVFDELEPVDGADAAFLRAKRWACWRTTRSAT